ncbi:MAG: adenylate/guanylate cyclase domain-containing protein, partial [Myxococcota bacterium]|nr:adenylate/guanylate cyclase domain-containing protein [Myxococcota bacterium]
GILHSSKTFDIGVGINLGEMMLGTIGAKGRLEGTVISDAVNTAARIESLTKTYGAGLIISQSTRRNLINPGRFTIRVLDRVRVKGRHEPVIIYEVLDALPREVKRRRAAYMDTYEAAVKRFWARDFEGALRRFGECASLDPDDPVVQLFLRRARWFARQGAAPEWSGAFDAESIFGDGEAT